MKHDVCLPPGDVRLLAIMETAPERPALEQTVAPPCKNTPIPGMPEVPGAVDPKTTSR